jgi:hypothetical protein
VTSPCCPSRRYRPWFVNSGPFYSNPKFTDERFRIRSSSGTARLQAMATNHTYDLDHPVRAAAYCASFAGAYCAAGTERHGHRSASRRDGPLSALRNDKSYPEYPVFDTGFSWSLTTRRMTSCPTKPECNTLRNRWRKSWQHVHSNPNT